MNRISLVIEKAKSFYDNGDPGHDFAHIQRVVSTCERLGRSVGADLECLLPAAVLHDVVNVPKNSPDRMLASAKAAEQAKELLADCGFSSDEISRISNIITEHSYSLGKKPTSPESAVLQDADKLDALGAIGIMRTVTCGARMGSSYYHQNEPIPEGRALDDKRYTIDHFFVKLLKLPDLMNTEAGKQEALERAEYMIGFLEQLRREVIPGDP